MPRKRSTYIHRYSSNFSYQGKQIDCVYWAHLDGDKKPDTVLFLGIGQIGMIPKWVASNAPAGVVVVQGLPHWHSDPSANDLVEFTLAYASQLFTAVRNTFSLASMHVIGTSQSTPGTVWLANHASKHVGNVVLIAPMGLTAATFGSNDIERLQELRKRARKTFFQPTQSPFHDIRNVYIAAVLLRIIISGIRDGSTANKYATGIAQDMIEEFRALTANPAHQVTLIVGANDALFPASEVEEALHYAKVTVDIEIIQDMEHGSLALKSRRPLVAYATKTVRSVRLHDHAD